MKSKRIYRVVIHYDRPPQFWLSTTEDFLGDTIEDALLLARHYIKKRRRLWKNVMIYSIKFESWVSMGDENDTTS